MQRKVSLPKLVQMDSNIRPYLTALMIAAMDTMEETFIVPSTAKFDVIAKEEFYEHLATLA
jgi:hypothetical protein